MFKKFIDPFLGHYQIPLLVLKILLLLSISHFSSLINHGIDFVRIKSIENFEKEIAFWRLTIILREVISNVRPISHLWVNILDSQ